MIDFKKYGYQNIEHFWGCKKIKDSVNKYITDRKILKKELINNTNILQEEKESILGKLDKDNEDIFSSKNLKDKRIMFIDHIIQKYFLLKCSK